jgi:hypothetical protein
MTLDDDDERLDAEEVERRRALRAPVPGLRITLTAPRAASFEAVEASASSFFVRAADPERFRLGEIFEGAIEKGGRRAAMCLEVIRKESHPRAGVALRVATIDPHNQGVLEEILAPLAPSIDQGDE